MVFCEVNFFIPSVSNIYDENDLKRGQSHSLGYHDFSIWKYETIVISFIFSFYFKILFPTLPLKSVNCFLFVLKTLMFRLILVHKYPMKSYTCELGYGFSFAGCRCKLEDKYCCIFSTTFDPTCEV